MSRLGKVSRQQVYSQDDMMCLQLHDTTLQRAPVHLEELFQHYAGNEMFTSEILFQLVYLVALESGFAELNSYEKCASELNCSSYTQATYFDAYNVERLSQEQPIFSCINANATFRMQLCSTMSRLHNADDNKKSSNSTRGRSRRHSRSASPSPQRSRSNSISSNHTPEVTHFLLTAIVTGDYMIVTLTPMQQHAPSQAYRARSADLTIPRHVIGIKAIINNKSVQKRLRKLDELTLRLRDEIFVPIQNDNLAYIGIELYPSLVALPAELYDCIFHCLSPRQLRALANVNKQLNELVVHSKHYKRKGKAKGNTCLYRMFWESI